MLLDSARGVACRFKSAGVVLFCGENGVAELLLSVAFDLVRRVSDVGAGVGVVSDDVGACEISG
jgi:hypothetical protein